MCSRSNTADFLSVRVRFEDNAFAICCPEIKPDMSMEKLVGDVLSYRSSSSTVPLLLVYDTTSTVPVICDKIGQCVRNGKKHDVELLFKKSTDEELDAMIEFRQASKEVEEAVKKRNAAFERLHKRHKI